MATKVAINGFGRIGRLVARAILSRTDHDLELVSINDLGDAKANALLFKRDSVHGNWAGDVSAEGDALIINGKRIAVTAERDPAKLPHAAQGVEIALECTGIFASKEKASAHLTAGAKRVIISAPAGGVGMDGGGALAAEVSAGTNADALFFSRNGHMLNGRIFRQEHN